MQYIKSPATAGLFVTLKTLNDKTNQKNTTHAKAVAQQQPAWLPV